VEALPGHKKTATSLSAPAIDVARAIYVYSHLLVCAKAKSGAIVQD
jgi:hypothetical protein